MNSSIVAFLDLLGFSGYTNENVVGTARLLADQDLTLSGRLDEQSNPNVAGQLHEWMKVDGFDHFLPFSDSALVIGRDPDKFLRQLADFVRACFLLNSHAYTLPDNPNRPEQVLVHEASLSSLKAVREVWYPAQWRGALAIGEVHVMTVTAIEHGNRVKVPNAVGPAVVEAVKLEKSGKGPRLFCANSFPHHVGSDLQAFFQPVEGVLDVSEFLWPAVQGSECKFDRNMNSFWELWSPALKLWKSKQRPHVAFEHYDEFLRLLIRSALCVAKLQDSEKLAGDFIRNRIRLDMGETD